MPKSSSPPKYRHFKPRNLAVVRIDGKDHYLGAYGSPESWEQYHRLLANRLSGRAVPSEVVSELETGYTITDLVADYWRFAEQHYRKNGAPTGQLTIIRDSVRPLRQLFGSSPAASFGCRELKLVRSTMVDSGRLCRTEINRRISVIRRVFRWGVSESLVPASVTHALRELLPLQRGRCGAREALPVQAVPDEVVEATLSFLPKILQDVVRLQRLTGCRPGEVLQMRPGDIERSSDVWIYRPASHKTEHHGKERKILLGPQAQILLLPYLERPASKYCFSPAESVAQRREALRKSRLSKVQPSQIDRRRQNPKRSPRERYDRHAYSHAIQRAVRAVNKQRVDAFVKEFRRQPSVDEAASVCLASWHPNQLRHSAATAIRSSAGIEVAATVLGHSKPDTTLIYAAADTNRAAEVVRRLGQLD